MGLLFIGSIFYKNPTKITYEDKVLMVFMPLFLCFSLGGVTLFVLLPKLFIKEKSLERVKELAAHGKLTDLNDLELVKSYEATRDNLDKKPLSDMLDILEARGLVEKDKVSLGSTLFFAEGNNNAYIFTSTAQQLRIRLSQKILLLLIEPTPDYDELIRSKDIIDARIWGDEFVATLHFHYRRKAFNDEIKVDVRNKSVWVETLRSQGVNVTEGREG